jgi:hypothetical protein
MALLTVERARSGRSKCVSSQEPIELGELRVGVQAWMGGRTTVCWQRVPSFLENGCAIGYAQNSAASCKSTGLKLPKGDLRLAIRNGPTSRFYVSWEPAIGILRQVLMAAGASASDLPGFDELNDSDRRKVKQALKLTKQERSAFFKENPHPCEGAAPDKKKRARDAGECPGAQDASHASESATPVPPAPRTSPADGPAAKKSKRGASLASEAAPAAKPAARAKGGKKPASARTSKAHCKL